MTSHQLQAQDRLSPRRFISAHEEEKAIRRCRSGLLGGDLSRTLESRFGARLLRLALASLSEVERQQRAEAQRVLGYGRVDAP